MPLAGPFSLSHSRPRQCNLLKQKRLNINKALACLNNVSTAHKRWQRVDGDFWPRMIRVLPILARAT